MGTFVFKIVSQSDEYLAKRPFSARITNDGTSFSASSFDLTLTKGATRRFCVCYQYQASSSGTLSAIPFIHPVLTEIVSTPVSH